MHSIGERTVTEPIGVLVMAYGTASDPDDIERYYTDIRGGRPPTPERLADLQARFAAIGDRFPLLEITTQQASGLERELNAAAAAAGEVGEFRSYLGMKHSPPFISDAVERMRGDGIHRAVGIVMAPHWSGMSVETYIERVEKAAAEGGPSFAFARHFHDHPLFVGLLAERVSETLHRLPQDERERATVVFSAHSLPVTTGDDGEQRCLRCGICRTSCRYPLGLRRTADLVAKRLGLPADRYTTGWQSAGRTADPWFGPPIDDLIRHLAADGATAVVVCSAGFTSDHLEILFDLDIEARAVAEGAGISFARTEMPNADPAFIRVLAAVVRDALAGGPSREIPEPA